MRDIPPARLRESCERLLGSPVTDWQAIRAGYTTSQKWRVTTASGESAFAKYATKQGAIEGLQNERLAYASLDLACVPRLIGWQAGTREALLLLEDLSDATWPPPWTDDVAEQVVGALRELQDVTAPPELRRLADADVSPGAWEEIGRSPEGLVGLGVCSEDWLARARTPLRRAATASTVTGKHVVHGDVVRGNLCFRDGQALLVDWSYAARGSPKFDLAFWLPAQHSEGGPLPDRFLPDSEGLSARLAGFWAVRAVAELAPELKGLSAMYRRYVASALDWAARELGLPPPDGHSRSSA